MRLLVQNFLHIGIISEAFGVVVVEALAVEDFAALVFEREVQADVIDRLVAGVGDFARDYEVGRHAARMHDHVARDYNLELVVGNYLRFGMIVAGVHVRFGFSVIAVLYIDASAGKGDAGCTEGQKNPDCYQFFHVPNPHPLILVRSLANVNLLFVTTAEHLLFMADAIAEARRAEAEGEVPVGAIAVADGQIVGAGHNRPIGLGDPTAHAEILAIRAAASTLKTYRLTLLSIYVTLEPCVMCVGAMLNARIARVVYGARDEKAGALGSVYDIGRDGRLNHRFEVIGGVMESECAELMRGFFRSRRGGA